LNVNKHHQKMAAIKYDLLDVSHPMLQKLHQQSEQSGLKRGLAAITVKERFE
jgi:hypothetical protein